MEKITLKALQLAGFQNADSVAKILNYVPNPQAAVELLLGVYTPTVVDKEKKFRSYRYTRNNEIAEMVSIDDFANTVTYNVLKQKTKRVWYLTSEDRNKDVYVTERPEKSYDYADKPANGFAKEQYTTGLDLFNSDWCNELSVEDAHSRINTWMMFDIVVAPYDPETLSPTEVVEF
jgi:hypothetical protein